MFLKLIDFAKGPKYALHVNSYANECVLFLACKLEIIKDHCTNCNFIRFWPPVESCSCLDSRQKKSSKSIYFTKT